MTGWVLAAVAVGAVGLFLVLRRRLLVIAVSGQSMFPTYVEGDRLLVRRVRPGRLRRGDIVVIERPDTPGWRDGVERWFVKRVAAMPGERVPPGVPVPDTVVPPGCLVVRGDNPARSVDSRQTGYFPMAGLVGVVVRRIGGAPVVG